MITKTSFSPGFNLPKKSVYSFCCQGPKVRLLSFFKGKSGQLRHVHFVRVSLRNLATKLGVKVRQLR